MNADNVKIGTNRSFGIVFFFVFIIISFYPLLNGENIRIWSLIISIVFLALGLFNSKLLNPLNNNVQNSAQIILHNQDMLLYQSWQILIFHLCHKDHTYQKQ